MPTITSAGIGSNLDVESIIKAMVNVERVPISQLQTRTDGLKTQLSAYGKVQSALSALRDAAAKLNNPDSWGANVASSSDATAVQVSAGGNNVAGTTIVTVSRLASAQSIASKPLAAAPASVGTGSLTIELGKWNADQSAFTAKSGVSAITIDIAPGEDQITQIRDKINAAKAGVVASIVTDASGPRLVMRSAETGENNGFRVTVADADGNPGDDQGLSALAFDPSAGITSATQNQAAANALATLNGQPVSTESNVLKDSIDGLTITLLKTTVSPTSSGEVTLNLAQDREGLKKSINDFVSAYNSLATLVRDQTKYDAATKTRGTLQGDSAVVGVQGQLRGLMAGSTSLAGAFGRLADIGLDPAADGSLKINASKLDKALAKLDDLKSFFMGLDVGNPDNDGFAQRVRRFADAALGSEGRISSRQKGLQDLISANGKRTEQLENRVELVEKRLRAQYTALDKNMGQLNGLSAYVSQQMAMLNRR